MKATPGLSLLVFCLALFFLVEGCAKDNTETTEPVAEAQYIGSAACKTCHPQIGEETSLTGHAHMVTTVVGGQKPGAPLLLPDQPPGGRTWTQIKYVVGGWGWAARFVDQSNVLLSGDGVQYNIPTDQYPTGEWAVSHPTDGGTQTSYDYSCFRCHTTGASSTAGTFPEAGVQCEACHGPGSLHAATPTRVEPSTDDSAALCGGCHTREASQGRILVTGGFIDSRQQYAELKDGPHKDFRCVTCHDPHVGVRRGQTGGIVRRCQSCHGDIEVNHFGNVDCITCHMPHATKSARSAGPYSADVRTHLFKIHEGPEDRSQMVEDSGMLSYVKSGYGVTLDYVCYQCHRNEQGEGGPNSTKTLQQLWAKAQTIHEDDDKTAGSR